MPRQYKKRRADFSHIEVPEGARLIPLTQGMYSLVDEEDYERVSEYSWCAHKAKWGMYYAVTNIDNKTVRLHRFIMNTVHREVFIDHKSLDTLDNRKSNLRPATNGENQHNTASKAGSSSQYKGVSFDKGKNKWVANIRAKDVGYYLGSFLSEEDAARAYDAKAVELCGDFARLNFHEVPF